MKIRFTLKFLVFIICATVLLNSCSQDDNNSKTSSEVEIEYRFIMESYQDEIVSIQFRNDEGGLDEGFNYDPELMTTGVWIKTVHVTKPFEPYLKVTFASPTWSSTTPFSLQIFVDGELQISKSTPNTQHDSMISVTLE